MFSACASYAARKDLTSFGNETAKCGNVFVINGVYVIYAALADLSSRSSVSAVTLVNHVFPSYQNGISSSKPMGEPKLSMPPWFWAFPLWEGVLP